MGLLEEIRSHLPSYLSPSKQDKLFDELKKFPNNIDERMYEPSHIEGNYLCQGDAVNNMPLIFLPDKNVQKENVFIISNTCDISPENRRYYPSSILYCPIVDYEKYSYLVKEAREDEQSAKSHLETLRNQRITSRFYLPEGSQIDESIVLFDKINNCRVSYAYDEISLSEDRIFSLSLYGFYLFIFKISVHLTRFQEQIERSTP